MRTKKQRKQKKTPDELSPRREFRRQYIADTRAWPHLLDRHEICAIANVSYPTVWEMMRAGTFPRSRIVGGKVMWLSTEVQAWIDGLARPRLKGDPDSAAMIET